METIKTLATQWAIINDEKYKRAIIQLSMWAIEDLGIEQLDDIDKDEVEQYAIGYWQELSDELVDAINDRISVACVVDKDAYGGGGFEVKRGLQIDVFKYVWKHIFYKTIK